MDSIASKYLRYGDFITLLGTTTNQKHGKNFGFLSCVGYSDKRVFYQQMPYDQIDKALKNSFSLSGRENEDVNPLSFVKNYQDFVFQVWPRLNFEAHKDHRKCLKERDRALKQVGKSGGSVQSPDIGQGNESVSRGKTPQSTVVYPMDGADTPTQQNHQQLIESIEQRLKILTFRTQQEKEVNQNLLEKFRGQTVNYGQTIQLMHFDSKMFLNGKIMVSEAEKSAYRFELSNQYSGGMMFRLSPKFKLRQLGEPIQFNDVVIIHNSKLNCYINFSMESRIELDRHEEQKGPSKQTLPINEVSTNDLRVMINFQLKTPRFETFMTLFSDTHWQIIKHGKGDQEENDPQNLRGGEIIRIRHTELNELLTADRKYIGDSPEVFLRWYMGDFPEEQLTLASLWRVEIDTPFHRGAHLHVFRQGDREPYYFRIRHILSGKLMGMTDITVGNQKKKTLALLKDEDIVLNSPYDLATRVIFIPTVKNPSNLLKGGYCYHFEVGGMRLRYMINPDFVNSKKMEPYFNYKLLKPAKFEGFYHQLTDKELNIHRKGVELTEQKSEEDAFWIESVSDELKREIGYIQSTIPRILRFTHFIMEVNPLLTMDTNQDFYRQVSGIMTDMINFITDSPEDSETPNDFPIPSRQRMFRNYQLIDYLTLILHYSIFNGLATPGQFSKSPSSLIELLKQCHALLRITIKEYRPNELYLSQWIELLMTQSMYRDPVHDIGAGQTLTELIDNNRFILENKIDENTINRFVVQLVNDRDAKYLQLLRALVNCDGEAMVGTQTIISMKILKQQINKSVLIPRIDYIGGQYQYYLGGDVIQFELLGDFRQINTEIHRVEFEYFINLLDLMADLCLDKNFIAIEELQDIFPLEMCKYVIKNIRINNRLRRAFCYLTLSLWIDGKQFPKLQIPNFVRKWDDVGKGKIPEMIYSDSDFKDFVDLKQFILEHLNKENERKFQCSFNEDINALTYTILQMCFMFMEYGFYKDQQEMKNLVTPLITYLRSCDDVTTKEEEEAKIKEINKQGGSQDTRRMTRAQKLSGKQNFKSRYLDSDQSLKLGKSRALVCKILLFINQLTVDVRSSYFLQEFREHKDDEVVKEQEEPEQQASSNILTKGFKAMGNLIPIKLDDLNPFKFFQDEVANDPDLIPMKWINKTLEMRELDLLDDKKEELVAILMDLIMYQNVDLISNAFTLLNDIYSLKIVMVHYLKNIQIIDDQDKLKLLNEVSNIKREITISADKAENWFGKEDYTSQETTVQFTDKVIRLRAVLMSKFLKKKNSGGSGIGHDQEIVIGDDLSLDEEDKLIQPRSQGVDMNYQQIVEHPEFDLGIVEKTYKEWVKPEFQKMMRNLEIHKSLIQLINFDLATNAPHTRENVQLLRSVYQFLAAFVFDSQENKELLRNHVKLFRNHLEKNKDILAHLVLQEIFRNNRVVLTNQKKLYKVIKGVCDIMMRLDPNDPLLLFLLDSLCIYMRMDGRVIKTNQVFVLNVFSLRQSLLFTLDDPAQYQIFLSQVKQLTDNFQKALNQPSYQETNEVKIPFDLNHFNVFLKVMSCAAENRNKAAESRCQTYFPLKKIHAILLATRYCWPIRRAMAQFYFDVYLEIEQELKDNQGHNPLIISELIDDLEYISLHYDDLISGNLNIVTFQDIIPCKKLFLDYLNKTLFPIFQITFQVGLISNVSRFSDKMTKLIKSTILAADRSPSAVTFENAAKLLAIIEANKSLVTQSKYADLKPESSKPLANMIRTLTKGPQIMISKQVLNLKASEKNVNQVKSINDIYSTKLDRLKKNEHFQKSVEAEIEQMVEHIVKIERLTQRKLKTITITFDQVVGQLIKLVDPRQDPLPKHLCLVGLKIFRKIIEKENPGQIVPASDWLPEQYALYEKKIQEKQNQLVKLGLVEIVFTIIKMDGDVELKFEAILVAIAMLLTGNESTQEAFYSCMQRDLKNLFMIQIKNLIDNQFDTIKKFSDRKLNVRDEALKQKKMFEKQNLNESIQTQTMKEKEAQSLEQSMIGDGSSSPLKGPSSPQNEPAPETEEELNQKLADQYELRLIQQTQRIFRFLQLLCEGHNIQLQNYLRAQIQNQQINGKSINFINLGSIRFGILLKSLCPENVLLHHHIMDFLIESVQGPCPENQDSLGASKIIDFCNELILMFKFESEYLRRGFITPETKLQVNSLVAKGTKTLLSLIEGNTTHENANSLAQSVEMEYLRKRIIHTYKQFVVKDLNLSLTTPLHVVNNKTYQKIDIFEGPMANSFEIYVLLISLADRLKDLEDQQDNLPLQLLQEVLSDESEQIAMEFYRTNTGSVEINFNGQLVRKFFPIAPTCRNLSKQTRQQFQDEVNRGSPNDKIGGLVSIAPITFVEMHHMSKLRRLPFQFTSERLEWLKTLSTLDALIINLVMIASSKRVLTEDSVTAVDLGELFGVIDTPPLITVLGLIQLVTSSLMLTFWIVINTPVILKAQWNSFLEENKQDAPSNRLESGVLDVNKDSEKYTTEEISYLFKRQGPHSIYFRKGEDQYLGSLFAKILYYIKSFIFLCSDPMFAYMFFYIIVSIMAVTTSEILYCFHLLDVINRSDSLKNVVRSLTRNINILFLTLILMCFIIYIYALILYTFFPENFYFDSVNENWCSTMFQCFLNSMQFGLRNGGGVADSSKMLSFQENYQEAYWIRVIYDLTFFGVITTISLNILIGVIIDTFAELRDEKNEKMEDMNNKCFICGHDRYPFEKNADGFKNHIERDHQLYNYLYFMHYLDNKPASELDGVESYCALKLEKGDIEWFPIMKAISLKNQEVEESLADKVKSTLVGIQNQVVDVRKKLESVKQDKPKLEKGKSEKK